jgi:hypothetical protein
LSLTAGLAGLFVVTLSGTGQAGAATTPSHAAKGSLRACINSTFSGSTNVTISGPGVAMTVPLATSGSAPKACSATYKVPAGNYTLTQASQPNYTLSSVKVSPNYAAQNISLPNRSAVAGVTAGSTTKVSFADLANPSDPPPPAGTGYIEVCKFAADNYVAGTVNISINDGTNTIQQTLPVGECTGPLQVNAGNVSVTETAPYPYYLKTATTIPSGNLVSISGSTVVVTVNSSPDSGSETRLNLYNATQMAYFKVCKTLTANSGDLTSAPNNTFTFDPYYQLAGSGSWQALPKVSVTVLTTGTQYCVVDPYTLPLGTLVKITEEQPDAVTLVGVSISPASQDAGTTNTQALFKIGPNASSTVAATFTNEAMGTIEICKLIDDSNWNSKWQAGQGNPNSPYNGTVFYFSVNGGSYISVAAGQCSAPISVPAGTATVFEAPTPNFSFEKYIAVGPDNSSRIASGSSSTSNPVTVNVPFGGVGNETLVTAINRVNTGQIKVCKINNGPSVGVYAFTFHTTWTSMGMQYTKDDTLRPMQAGVAGEVCSGLSAPIPVIQPNGMATSFTTTEGASPYVHDQYGNPTVEPTSIVYSGNGQVLEIRAWQQGDTILQDGTYHGTATVGQGVNVFTFTNSLVLDP